MCKLLVSISAVRGIIYGNWSYQIIPQPVTEKLSLYSTKSSDVLLHHFQGLGPVPWIDGRYHFRVLVGFLRVPLVIHCFEIGEINICVCACATNHFEIIEIIYYVL